MIESLPNKTHVLAVIDKSGSMFPLTADVIGGYNAYLDSLSAEDVEYRITCALFDTDVRTINLDSPVATAHRLDSANYLAQGSTSLLDAIGSVLIDFERVHPTLEANEKVILVISTDGEENSSREFSWYTINTMIDTRVAGGQWMSVYLGAGPSAWKQGSLFSGSTQVINTQATSTGTHDSYSGLLTASAVYSASGDITRSARVLRDAVAEDKQ